MIRLVAASLLALVATVSADSNCTSDAYKYEVLVKVGGDTSNMLPVELGLLGSNFGAIYNRMAENACGTEGMNRINTTVVTPFDFSVLKFEVSGACSGCPTETALFASKTTGIAPMGNCSCSLVNATEFLVLYDSSVIFVASQGAISGVTTIDAITEVDLSAPTMSTAPSPAPTALDEELFAETIDNYALDFDLRAFGSQSPGATAENPPVYILEATELPTEPGVLLGNREADGLRFEFDLLEIIIPFSDLQNDIPEEDAADLGSATVVSGNFTANTGIPINIRCFITASPDGSNIDAIKLELLDNTENDEAFMTQTARRRLQTCSGVVDRGAVQRMCPVQITTNEEQCTRLSNIYEAAVTAANEALANIDELYINNYLRFARACSLIFIYCFNFAGSGYPFFVFRPWIVPSIFGPFIDSSPDFYSAVGSPSQFFPNIAYCIFSQGGRAKLRYFFRYWNVVFMEQLAINANQAAIANACATIEAQSSLCASCPSGAPTTSFSPSATLSPTNARRTLHEQASANNDAFTEVIEALPEAVGDELDVKRLLSHLLVDN